MSTPICTSCKRRRAFYKRTYSGEYLCPYCVERSLVRAVKRVIGQTDALEPRSSVLVPISPAYPAYSIALARVLSTLERRFDTKLIIAIPSQMKEQVYKAIESLEDAERVEYRVPVDDAGKDWLSCVRRERRWSAELARDIGVSAVALPITRTDRLLAVLESMLRGDPSLLSEAELAVRIGEVTLFNAFGLVESELVAAYAYSIGVYTLKPLCMPRLLSKMVFYSVGGRRPELEYSWEKAFNLLLEIAVKRLGRCRLCGGFSDGTGVDVCRYCRSPGHPIIG